MAKASLPLMRMIAIPPSPGGVAIAVIVSFIVNYRPFFRCKKQPLEDGLFQPAEQIAFLLFEF